MTQPPMMRRSPGLSSTLSDMPDPFWRWRALESCPRERESRGPRAGPELNSDTTGKSKKAGRSPPFVVLLRRCLLEQTENRLLALVGQRQGRDGNRLTGRQRLAVGGFFVGVGESEVRRTGLQHIDQVLGEVLTDLHDRQVGTQSRRLRPESARRGVQRVENLVGGGVVDEVGTRGQGRQAESSRIVSHAGNVQRRLA